MGNCGGGGKGKGPIKIAGGGGTNQSHEFKIIITGDAGVGKTSLLLRLCKDTFTTGPMLSKGAVDFDSFEVNLNGTKITLHIWDTAGQERFRTITSSFYRGSHGIIFAFDINNPESFQNCSKWVKEADRYGERLAGRLVVATKCDTEGKRAISQASAEDFANNLDIPFIETSAKDNINVKEAFEQLAKNILDELERG